MKRILMTALLVTTLPAFAAKPEWVDNKHPGKGQSEHAQGKHNYQEREQNGDRQERHYRQLSQDDRQRLLRKVLVGHYGLKYLPDEHRYQALPPGLRKKLQRGGDLPPGWQKKLVPGQRLDADLYRNAEELPSDLLDAITGRQDGIQLLRIGDRIVRVAEGRGTVLDVIDLSDRALHLFDR